MALPRLITATIPSRPQMSPNEGGEPDASFAGLPKLLTKARETKKFSGTPIAAGIDTIPTKTQKCAR